ncbi:flavin reductase family protein [Streptomyces sp. NPDC014894]|uniref:flavin reductase family protein n=1 Tax=unclassified Streptomyces TaxID=2593676 RepID=UPI0036F73D5F
MTVPVRKARPLDGDEAFKDALALLPAALAIVTTRDENGRRWGLTASSVASVSLDPPLVLVGISHTSSCFKALSRAPGFVINLLGDRHRELARRFATSGIDRFAGQPFTDWPGTALPHLADAHAAFRCRTVDRVRAGDHDLLIGRLTELRADGGESPLLWYRRGFAVPAE